MISFSIIFGAHVLYREHNARARLQNSKVKLPYDVIEPLKMKTGKAHELFPLSPINLYCLNGKRALPIESVFILIKVKNSRWMICSMHTKYPDMETGPTSSRRFYVSAE